MSADDRTVALSQEQVETMFAQVYTTAPETTSKVDITLEDIKEAMTVMDEAWVEQYSRELQALAMQSLRVNKVYEQLMQMEWMQARNEPEPSTTHRMNRAQRRLVARKSRKKGGHR